MLLLLPFKTFLLQKWLDIIFWTSSKTQRRGWIIDQFELKSTKRSLVYWATNILALIVAEVSKCLKVFVTYFEVIILLDMAI